MHRYLAAYADFNVFRRKRNPSLCCAVRQDQPVPSFICGEAWEFSGTTTLEEPVSGLHPELVSEATRVIGYHLFKTPEMPSVAAA